MSAAPTKFADLMVGRSNQRIIARLFRVWEARNPKKGGQLMWMKFLLLDETPSLLHGSVSLVLYSRFEHLLKEGAVLEFEGFEVVRSNETYKVADSNVSIRLTVMTKLFEFTDTTPMFAHELFRLKTYEELTSLANTNTSLPDVIGRLCSIKDFNAEDQHSTQRITLRLQLSGGMDITITAWDQKAIDLRSKLQNLGANPSVILVSNVNPKFVGGSLFLNSTSATRFYFPGEAACVGAFIESIKEGFDDGLNSHSRVNNVVKIEAVSILDLFAYMTTSDHKEAEFFCTARILDVLNNNGWSYIACAKCSRKLKHTADSLFCTNCQASTTVGVTRFRVEFKVGDGTETATFVAFDRDAT